MVCNREIRAKDVSRKCRIGQRHDNWPRHSILIVVSHDPNLRDSELPTVVDNATNATHGSRVIATGSGHYI
jgi:hypothetical protein